MGYASALDMRAHAPEDAALEWHLQANHFPPVPLDMLPAVKRALRAMRAGDPTQQIRLPEGALWRGHKTAPASAFVESFHLDAFLAEED